MAGIKLITAPTVEPITLTEAKDHCRVDGTDDDTLITSLIVAAREYVEGYQNRALITQTWELVLDAWPDGDSIELPLPPLQSVTSLKYKDSAGAETAWAATNYIVDTDSYLGRLVLADDISWPSDELYPAGGIRIRFVAGYPPTGSGESIDYDANVPQKIKQAMLLLVGHWYENREAVAAGSMTEIPLAVNALLSQDRVVPI